MSYRRGMVCSFEKKIYIRRGKKQDFKQDKKPRFNKEEKKTEDFIIYCFIQWKVTGIPFYPLKWREMPVYGRNTGTGVPCPFKTKTGTTSSFFEKKCSTKK